MSKTHQLDELPTPFVFCRTFGHSWEEFIPVGKKGPIFGFRFSLLCTHCGTERHDILDSSGTLLTREYVYPDKYQVSFKLDRADYRVELNSRKRKRARRGDLEISV